MRIRNIANRIEELGGTCDIKTHRRKDARYVVKLTGKVGQFDIEATDYNAPSRLSTVADAAYISVKREDEQPSQTVNPWKIHRTISAMAHAVTKKAAR
ncbi:hypothetical protein GCM10023084_53930 [Streptomyces lacrimifluminis]|uniref:Uncharacterized protein n=1 Tax=Streptomyces lacrimifluminis TaxID=1500077 RepID=A0A917KXG0_9ACTN|nr:hypothetical protein [Streptomyces lacrimifluminis]GGJ34387.1 hypothetical protein GCM10012282_33930 [Streptomyces lacrimifluminis]